MTEWLPVDTFLSIIFTIAGICVIIQIWIAIDIYHWKIIQGL